MRKPNAMPGGGPNILDRRKDGAVGVTGRKADAKAFSKRYVRTTPGGAGGGVYGAAGEVGGFAIDGETIPTGTGTSIFDPVLTELTYRWFCPTGGLVLDPFAGGSVRGIVASKLGRQYVGIDLRGEQIEANRVQGEALCDPSEPMPVWIEGDSRNLVTLVGDDLEADFILSCPPYADLEVYSEDERDLSTMEYEDFIAAYREIIAAAASKLKDNRFACFVVGDVRDPKGMYRGFPWHTIQAFQDAGLSLYNEAVLITAVGSLPLRAGKYFTSGRKLGKTHQNVLIFLKGDPRKATQACGEVELDESIFRNIQAEGVDDDGE